MKFAKELDDHAIPEWKAYYLDYRAAKKKLKALGKAVRNVDRAAPGTGKSPFSKTNSVRDAPVFSFLHRGRDFDAIKAPEQDQQRALRTSSEAPGSRVQATDADDGASNARTITAPNERSALRTQSEREGAPRLARYGSIIGSPPSGASPLPDLTPQRTQASLLELPDPALAPTDSKAASGTVTGPREDGNVSRPVSPGSPDESMQQSRRSAATKRQLENTGNAYEIGRPTTASHPTLARYGAYFLPKRTASAPDVNRPAFLRRVFPGAGTLPPKAGASSRARQPSMRSGNDDVALEAYREADFRQAEFLHFLDKQLDKIEKFYHIKEAEATERLGVLREQLHILRNRRLEEIVAAEQRQSRHHHSNGIMSFAPENLPWAGRSGEEMEDPDQSHGDENGAANGAVKDSSRPPHGHRWASVTSQVDNAWDKVRTGRVGKTSKAMEELGTPSSTRLDPGTQDYVRRQPKEAMPPYRVAKRKLKLALQEYYRSLELLKSYTLLNRTAFRKINKKFDKTVNSSSGAKMRYMSDIVNKAHFVSSDVIDQHIHAIEDLYARYFERGNRKVAIGKLRGRVLQVGDYTGSLWRTGLFLGSGIVLGIQGLVYGSIDLFDPDPVFRIHSSYLMQIYAGYFLFLLLVGLFCIDARIFAHGKVNYQFVFEFDSRHVLDWRQLSEIPSVFFFLLALTLYLNFTVRAGGADMYIYWPVVLVGVSCILMLLPPPLFFWESRRWFLQSLWRLSFAGIYPVEFRDFFLGDMFCSETYAMGNIELFFCLYATHWNDPPMCNSSHSRLLGFFSTLPGIWRALQCIRRYYDTRNWFPHLANCGKYTFTILTYMSLSLFRINKTNQLKALFIAVAAINSIYTSVWDVIMDWSLGNVGAKNPLLRDVLAFKRHVWFYYFAMVIDPMLRCNWILYAIFADDVQHSSIISFVVGLSEVCRRGMWTILRVENEHCTNVRRNRVVRDVELPYQRTSDETLGVDHFDGTGEGVEDTPPPTGDEESASASATAQSTGTQQLPQLSVPSPASLLRQRKTAASPMESPVAQALRRVGSTLASAHSQDYEKKRRPVQAIQEEERDSDDEEEDDENENEAETAAAEELEDRAR